VALGIIFLFFLRRHLLFSIFPFPVSSALLRGEFCSNRQSGTKIIAPIVLAECIVNYWRSELFSANIQSGVNSKRQEDDFADFFHSPHFAH
jgi:hypothetical protein